MYVGVIDFYIILHQNIVIMSQDSGKKKKINWFKLVIDVLTVVATFFAGANAEKFI